MSEPAHEVEGTRENLAARIVELERELAELRARQSGMQTLTRPMWMSDWYMGSHDFMTRPHMFRNYVCPEGGQVSQVKQACVWVTVANRWVSTPPTGFVGDEIAASRPLEEAKMQAEEQIMEWWTSSRWQHGKS